jgi:hypothetical protein
MYRWLEQLIFNDEPFNFVENKYVKKNSKLEPIGRRSLLKYLEMLGIKVERKLREILPTNFGIVVDGWTMDTEHYFAIFACWTDKKTDVVKINLFCCGVQDELPDNDSVDFSAESLGDYIFDELALMGKTFENVEFIVGNNTAVMPKLAHLISNKTSLETPLIGCSSHKLHLAVLKHISENNVPLLSAFFLVLN